jgi:8-oxo-dGTP pyrophosphatase MutT (NUDIX family)
MKTTNGAYIIDSLGKILVTHPTNHSMDLWSIPKGLYEDGETSLDAAIRETIEETSLDVTEYTKHTTYTDLGVNRYKSNKKEIHGHLFIINKPLSEMNLNLECTSMFICNRNNVELPENNFTKWETIEFAENHLHESQLIFLKKIRNLLVHKI